MEWFQTKISEGSQLYEGIVQLKMLSSDGKYYKTDVATTQQLFRLIQSIPSPKAEPFKLWMAQVAAERLDQMQDPELSIEQAMNAKDNGLLLSKRQEMKKTSEFFFNNSKCLKKK